MNLDDGKTSSLSERLSAFLADHDACDSPLDSVRDGALVTLTCGECGRSFSYASRVPERSTAELVSALDRLSSAVEATGSPSPNGAATASPASELRANEEDTDSKWTPDPPSPPKRRRRLAPPGPFAPQPRRRSYVGRQNEKPATRPAPPGPLAPIRVRTRGPYRVRRLRRAVSRALEQTGRRRREIALTVLGLGGAYVIVALGSGAEPSSSRPEEAVQGGPVSSLVEPAAGTKSSAKEAQPLTTPGNPPPQVTRDRITLLEGRLSVLLPGDWEHTEPLGGSAILLAPDGTARVVILPAALTGASGEEPAKTLRAGGRAYAVIVRSSSGASEAALDGVGLVVRSLRPAGWPAAAAPRRRASRR